MVKRKSKSNVTNYYGSCSVSSKRVLYTFTQTNSVCYKTNTQFDSQNIKIILAYQNP